MSLVLCDERIRLLDTDGHILVRGGAGSGKTTIALLKAGADLERGKLPSTGKALFLSFARATVARVAEAAMATLPPEHRARLEINTYHGFAWALLRSHAYLLGQRPGVSLLMPSHARGRLSGLTGDDRLRRERELFEVEGLLTFDLFAPLATALLGNEVLLGAYARAYPLIIVDEFQDTNSEEWALIKRLGARSTLVALGDPKQRIYDFKGADPKRFDEFIDAFNPTTFDFKNENNRSAGTAITTFADDVIAGRFSQQRYEGVTITAYRDVSLFPLKQQVLAAASRLNRAGGDWSLGVLVPSNSLAAAAFDFMRGTERGLPRYGADLVVSAEGPTLAAQLIALLLESGGGRQQLAVDFLKGLAAFNLGRNEEAGAGATKLAGTLSTLAAEVAGDETALTRLVVGRGVSDLLDRVAAHTCTGDPISDWLAIRGLLDGNPRAEIQAVGKEARHMRLLRRGAQIEARFAEAWRQSGCYRDSRRILDAALVEDQFLATTRPMQGVTIMTIHKAKGKEFDEVIVYEGKYSRFVHGESPEALRSARFNLHVAVTRARRAAAILTPASEPSRLLC